MKRLFLYLTIIALPIISAGCKKQDSSDLKSIMTTEANGSMSSTTIANESSTGEKTTETKAEGKKNSSKSNISEISESFSKNKSRINYPRFSGINSKNESSINKMIEDNAKIALDSFNSSTDVSTELSYNIKNQSRNRISIVYTGTSKEGANSKKVIFTNNINLETGKSIGLSDFADPITLANYVLSDDVVLENASNAQAAGFEEYKKTLSVDILRTLFEDADFPLIKENDINEGFPKVFSYESGGDIFIAMPVSPELGDYIIIKYSPDTK